MNYKIVLKTIGKILCIEAILLMLPLIVSFIYQDNNQFAFLITIGVLALVGLPLVNIKANKQMFVREGFIIVGLTWIIIALFGCLPFIISKEIPSFFDAFFEISSGCFSLSDIP